MIDTKILMDKILLIGDTIIDINTEGVLLGTSPETPTLVITKDTEIITHGGAALVHRNLSKLNCNHEFVTNDYPYSLSKKTTTKHRYWCNKHKLLQVDDVDNTPITAQESDLMFEYIQRSDANVIAIADYRHGLLSPKLIELINNSNKRIILDSQVSKSPANHHMYKHIYLTLLNEHEAKQYVSNVSWDNPEKLKEGLYKEIDSLYFIVKFGKLGCIYFDSKTSIQHRTHSVENPVDESGAGDAFMAGLLAWMQKGSSINEASGWANEWARRSVMVKGANPPDDE